MQTIKKFSGSTVAPTKNATYSFSDAVDGQIRKAVLGTDYKSAKGFLVAMSRYANSNGLTVNRYVHPDGSAVEFQLIQNSTTDIETEATADVEASEAF
jgi:hypothetical protein